MQNRYWEGLPVERDDPAEHAVECVPSDDLIQVARSLYIGTGGDVTVILYRSEDPVTFKNVADGTFLPLTVKKVMSTGTDAGDIILIDPTVIESP